MLDRITSAELVLPLGINFTFSSGKSDYWGFDKERIENLMRDAKVGGLSLLYRVPVEWDGDNWRVYKELIK